MYIKKIAAVLLCIGFLFSASSCSLIIEKLITLPSHTEETLSQSTSVSDTTEPSTQAGVILDPIASSKDLSDIIDIEESRPAKRDGIADVVEKIQGPVVAINVYGTARDYFNREYPTEGAGSGVIISKDGYIVTNNHVITGGDTITVFLHDGRDYQAEVIGSDEKSDLAVLKIDAEGLTNAKIGESSTLRVGDYAIAVGNPLGELQGTVSMGIISALDRLVNVDGNDLVLLQTDAAVNPGNSGGGLFDSNGDLIGVVTAKEAAENVEGLGFAIPMDIAKPIIADLLSFGYVTGRPTVGIETILISSRYSALYNNVSKLGVYVYKVHSGSLAEQAGLKRADFIDTVDGVAITSENQFWSLIESKKVGDEIKIVIFREGVGNMDINLTIEEAH
ncbi:MAG: trypsin-like serine protease [Ruminococcaceae bacterium]|nr:trypsin-like serine protease [Oscillospiraceae bacterium]